MDQQKMNGLNLVVITVRPKFPITNHFIASDACLRSARLNSACYTARGKLYEK